MSESDSAEARDRPSSDGLDARPRLTYRFATTEDLRQFYGEIPSQTIRAVVVVREDEPLVVMGLANRRDHATLFTDYKLQGYEMRRSITVARAIKLAMKMVKESKRQVYSVREEGTDLLVRLGFEQVADDLYRWPTSES